MPGCFYGSDVLEMTVRVVDACYWGGGGGGGGGVE